MSDLVGNPRRQFLFFHVHNRTHVGLKVGLSWSTFNGNFYFVSHFDNTFEYYGVTIFLRGRSLFISWGVGWAGLGNSVGSEKINDALWAVRCITSKRLLFIHLKQLSFSSSKVKVTCKSESVFFSFGF